MLFFASGILKNACVKKQIPRIGVHGGACGPKEHQGLHWVPMGRHGSHVASWPLWAPGLHGAERALIMAATAGGMPK